MLAETTRKSYPDPRPGNPKGLRAPFQIFIPLCDRHKFEGRLLPLARSNGWPMRIDFAALPGRIRRPAVLECLAAVIKAKEANHFWREIEEEVKKRGSRRVVGAEGQYASFEKTQPG